MFSWLRLCSRRSAAAVPAVHALVPTKEPPSWYMIAHDPRTDKTSWIEISRREFDDYSVYIRAHGFHIPLACRTVLPAEDRWSTSPLTVKPEARLLSIVLVDEPQEQSETKEMEESDICEVEIE